MTKLAQAIGKILLVAAAAFLGQIASSALLTAILGPVWPESPGPETVFVPLALAQLLTVSALWVPARWSRLQKRPLFRALFSAIFGLGVFLTHVEAAVFLVMTTDQLLFGVTSGTLQALWVAWLVATIFGKAGDAEPEPTAERWPIEWRRLVLSSSCYLALYLGAGMLIYAQVQEFYATQSIPAFPLLIALQLVRGALYVVFVSSLLRSSTLGRGATALAMAVMFPVLAGVASLLVPNALLPETVRLWHMLEIGVSNFLFGALVGFLFWSGDGTRKPPREVPDSTTVLESPSQRLEPG